MLDTIKIAVGILTALTGLLGILNPAAVSNFTGLTAAGSRGIVEIRVALGALYVGLGLAPIFLRQKAGYQVLGYGYLAMAVVRIITLFTEKNFETSNIVSILIEVIFGLVLVW